MPYKPLKNYLRTARRRSGLSQDEIAQLLGARSGSKICRYETLARVPAVSTVFALEIIFRVSVRELFAGTYAEVHCTILRRAKRLMKDLADDTSKPARRKLLFLRGIVEADPRERQKSA